MRNNTAEIVLLETGELMFDCSYDAGLIAAFKAKIPTAGRKPHYENGKFDHWRIAPEYGEACADLVEQFFGFRPNVPGVKCEAKATIKTVKLMYLGSAKQQPNGERIARGHDVDGWNIIIPENVLREYFQMPLDPSEAVTYYGVLGVHPEASQDEIKRAHKRAVMAWHPDRNKSTDATRQMQVIQEAYEILSHPRKKAMYDSAPFTPDIGIDAQNWKSPLNCGILVCEGRDMLGRFNVSKILAWEDIFNDDGQIMAVSWGYDRNTGKFDDNYTVEWM